MGKAQQRELSNGDLSAENRKRKATEESGNSKRIKKDGSEEHYFIGDPVSMQEAHRKWPHRYPLKDGKRKKPSENDVQTNYARCHYKKCVVEGVEYKLNDSVYMKGEEGGPNYIGRLVELFEATTGEQFCTCQWFYRITDTVIRDQAAAHDGKRVFLSDVKDDNLLESIVMKLKIMHIDPVKEKKCIESCDYYYDLHYSPPYSTFARSLLDNSGEKNSSPMVSSSGDGEKTLLDLYSGCGGMSTGLCMGAQLAGVNLTTRWAVDLDEDACESFRLNHPESRVRNEKVSDFLNLLMEWKTLCMKYGFLGKTEEELGTSDLDEVDGDDGVVPSGEFEVGRILGIRYGEKGLEFEVRWKGYGPDDDTWEPLGNLGKCDERIETFVRAGYLSKILPLPGDVDVICGGPPCQGISGFNRFRNKENPLDDPLNHQLVVFMDVVDFLKPKYILMENVVDILKFSNGLLGRYALGRLVNMKYQARLGLMAAGCYGVPQFRMRFFLWGAAASEELPQYPLPTHDVVVRGGIPNEFEQTLVAFNETEKPKLEKELLLGDAISDLPPVSNDVNVDLMEYKAGPLTEFQRYIRLSKEALYNSGSGTASSNQKLYDHRPLQLNQDDHARVKQIPKKKGANFRDLRGVLLGPDNVVKWDPNVERVYLESGKPLVPDYAMSFVRGRSSKPFGRLWWDETVPTVVTRAEPHNQRILHPEQDRVLSIRENARLQGFPDYYQLQGPVKKRYMQIGNAVAVPVARALGYSLGKAMLKDCGSSPLMTLPANFPLISKRIATSTGDKSESDVE